MGFLMQLKNLLVKLEVANNSIFNCPVEQQKAYLSKFSHPKDDIERSFYQYKCQMFFYPRYMVALLNFVSLPVLIFYYFKKNDNNGSIENVDAIFFADGKPDSIIPNSLRTIYDYILQIDNKRQRLTHRDKKFFLQIVKRYPFSWQFLLKCLLKIRFYSFELESHCPKAIIVCNEYSFTSSILTQYCEERNVTHINVMHGEKLYYIRDSFFRFHKCFVWDREYQKLLKELRAEPGQFVVEVPPSLIFTQKSVVQSFDFTYYLGAENGDSLDRVMNALDDLANKGYKVALRPHPRYTHISEINEKQHQFDVEDRVLTIEQSLLRTKNAISVYSTVLNQAFHNGVNIVIDDVTNSYIFSKLEELNYVMLKKKHYLLSQILEGK